MAPYRSQLHQPVFAVSGVQREGLPYEDGRRCRAEADTYPLVDADHVEDDECQLPLFVSFPGNWTD